jgi:hypothetical protein
VHGLETVEIRRTWDGDLARPDEIARLHVACDERDVTLEVDAPFHGDPPPGGPPGRCPRLFEHEVVELFLVGGGDAYLEVELGPHGHYLALGLRGVRNVVRPDVPVRFCAALAGARWRGSASFARTELPAGLARWNAFAMHGTGARRRYLAAHPLPGPQPDFHRIAAFPRLDRG